MTRELSRRYMRLIDAVAEDGQAHPIRLYACDVYVLDLAVLPETADTFIQNKYECRQASSTRKEILHLLNLIFTKSLSRSAKSKRPPT